MKKNLIIILIITIAILFTGCMSVQNAMHKNASVDYLGAYISGEFPTMKHYFVLKNLESGEKVGIQFEEKKYAQVVQVPTGKYAIVKLDSEKNEFLKGKTEYHVQIPYGMMKILYVNPGEILYLGRFEYNLKRDLSSIFTREGGSMNINMNIDEAFTSINDNYRFEKPMKIVPF